MPFPAALAADLSLVADTLWSAGVAFAHSARQRLARGIEVEVASGEDAVAKAAPAWRHLEASGGAATAFQTLAVAARAACAHVERGETPRIVIVHERGLPALLFPTVITCWNGLSVIRFLGDPLAQYGDVVAPAGTAPGLLAEAWRAAADPALASFIYLRRVRADACIAPLLANAAEIVAEEEAPFIDLRRSPAARPRALRELRRLRRRLAERGDVRFEILDGHAAGAAVREALDIKREWLAARGLWSGVIRLPAWERQLLALSGDPVLRVARLSVDGRTAALEVALAHDRRWLAFLGAVAPEFASAGPGHVQMAETVAHCRAQEFETYDLLAPADSYKRAMAHGAVPVRDYAAPLRGNGWLGMIAARALPTVKKWSRRVPPALRRIVTSRS